MGDDSVSFVDIALLLATMLIFVPMQKDLDKGNTSEEKVLPAVFLYITGSGYDYSAVCNGHKIRSPNDVIRIASYKRPPSSVVKIIGCIQDEVYYHVLSLFQRAIKLHNAELKRQKRKGVELLWDTQPLKKSGAMPLH